jgi:hypothetical protein
MLGRNKGLDNLLLRRGKQDPSSLFMTNIPDGKRWHGVLFELWQLVAAAKLIPRLN